jgi:magnesium-protoporphyrin IX monomethyl ester (oxidative) cyclase
MWVRDHALPKFHEALGVDIDWYDHEVLHKTSEMSKQIFPIALDLENPRWKRGLPKLQKAFEAMDRGHKKGGIVGRIGKFVGGARAAMVFVGLYMIPSIPNKAPDMPRQRPAY